MPKTLTTGPRVATNSPRPIVSSLGSAIAATLLIRPDMSIERLAEASGIAVTRWRAMIEGRALLDHDMAFALGALTDTRPAIFLKAQDDFILDRAGIC